MAANVMGMPPEQIASFQYQLEHINDDRRPFLYTVTWTLWFLAVTAICLRFYAQRMVRGTFKPEDGFIALGIVRLATAKYQMKSDGSVAGGDRTGYMLHYWHGCLLHLEFTCAYNTRRGIWLWATLDISQDKYGGCGQGMFCQRNSTTILTIKVLLHLSTALRPRYYVNKMVHSHIFPPNFPSSLLFQGRCLVYSRVRHLLVPYCNIWRHLPMYASQLRLEQEPTGPLYRLREFEYQHRYNQHSHRLHNHGHANANHMEAPAPNDQENRPFLHLLARWNCHSCKYT
jgi:hypothetical protein